MTQMMLFRWEIRSSKSVQETSWCWWRLSRAPWIDGVHEKTRKPIGFPIFIVPKKIEKWIFIN
jgi:hypothetical protein